jgi:acyl-coenzyme A thioesterase PaaI-like protein
MEDDQVYGRRVDLVGRGQVTWPAIRFTHVDETCLQGNLRFGRYFLGRHGVVHGGAILFAFDEMAGRLANLGNRTIARKVFLRTDFRAPAPIETKLRISSRFVRETGRKSYVRIELHHGELLCAEAEELMVAMLPGQP